MSTIKKKSVTKNEAPAQSPTPPESERRPKTERIMSIRRLGVTPATEELIAAVKADDETILALLDAYGGDDMVDSFVIGALGNVAHELAALSALGESGSEVDIGDTARVQVPYLLQKRVEAIAAVNWAIVRARRGTVSA